MKKIFIHGVVAGILATIASVIYNNLYQSTLGVSFDKIINIGSVFGACIFGCVLISVANFVLFKFKKENLQGILNVIVVVLSFVSIIGPISMTLPLDVEFPEMFPGLVIPMHFFPALAFFAIDPFFKQSSIKSATKLDNI
jgi:hypothetical protein